MKMKITEVKAIAKKGGMSVVMSMPVGIFDGLGNRVGESTVVASVNKEALMASLATIPKSAHIEVEKYPNMLLIKADAPSG